jgi:hypothetical protein
VLLSGTLQEEDLRGAPLLHYKLRLYLLAAGDEECVEIPATQNNHVSTDLAPSSQYGVTIVVSHPPALSMQSSSSVSPPLIE